MASTLVRMRSTAANRVRMSSVSMRMQPATSSRLGMNQQAPFAARSISSSSPMMGFFGRGEDSTPDSTTDAIQQATDAAGSVDYASISDLSYNLTNTAIRTLDIVHSTTGMPWWATIIASTVFARTLILPITIKSMKNTAKMKAMQPEMEKLQEEMSNSPKDPESLKGFREKHRALMKKHDVNPIRGFLGPLSQLPVFLGFFWGIRELPKYAPAYKTEGALWFPNLCEADPYMALPIISSSLMLASLELGDDVLPAENKAKFKMMMRGMALIIIPVTMNFESGLFVYWVTSNFFTLLQTGAFRVPFIKRGLGIPTAPQTKRISGERVGPVSPFEAAVASAKQNVDVSTNVNPPSKRKNNKK